MRKIQVITLLALFISSIFVTDAMARRGRGWSGKGWMRGNYARIYNPATVETIKGKVIEVGYYTPTRGMAKGVRLLVKTGKDSIAVHLGPNYYVDNQNVKIKVNDKIEVNGSKVIFTGSPVLIAKEVKRGSDILVLRDANGYPNWRGGKRR